MSSDHVGPALEQIEGLGQLGIALVRVTKNALCVVSLRVVFHTPSIAMNSGE